MRDEDIVIVGAARTAIGTFGGAFRDVSARDLGATAIREALLRSGLQPNDVDEAIMGCVGQVGRDAYIARTAALTAGLPQESSALTVNRACGSGLQAIISAAETISFG